MKYRLSKHPEFTHGHIFLTILAVIAVVASVWYYIVWVAGQPKLTADQTRAARNVADTINDLERGRNPLNTIMFTKVTSIRQMTDEEIRSDCQAQPELVQADHYLMVSLSYWDLESGLGTQKTTMNSCNLDPPR